MVTTSSNVSALRASFSAANSKVKAKKPLTNGEELILPAAKDNGTPLQCSCLENPMDGGAWRAAVHGVTEGRTRLSGLREMATHSSVLAWRIPGMRDPGGLPSLGSHRVGHD